MAAAQSRILVFQHIECEHPGSLRGFAADDGAELCPVHLYAGEPVPALEGYDALWVMGGPMDVWDVEENPWLVPEKAAIRRWVREVKRPFLGLCLGHQLLADALGGTCGPQRPPEIGVLDIALTEEGKADPLFAGMPQIQKALQWHSVKVSQAPDDAVILASSDICRVQAMRIGNHAWSMQYHVEIEPDTIDNWAEIPAYHSALMGSIGEDGLARMKVEADDLMNDFLNSAGGLYRNFIQAVRAG